jgi:hypothetical protein
MTHLKIYPLLKFYTMIGVVLVAVNFRVNASQVKVCWLILAATSDNNFSIAGFAE